MTRLALATALAFAALPAAPLSAAEPASQPAPARIAAFHGDRKAALSLTFDDGLVDQLTHAVPILDAAGLKGTFAINPGGIADTRAQAAGKKSSWEDWQALAKNGHEIANHSMTHPKLPGLPKEKLETEITLAQQRIAEKIGAPCLSFVYPFNATNADVKARVLATHIVASGAERAGYGYGKDAAFHNKIVDAAVDRGEWKVAMIHAIKSGYAAFPSADAFKDHVAHVKARQDVLWVDTLANVSRYVQQRDASVLSATAGDKSVTLTLTCPLDPKVFDRPLTVVVGAPGAAQASATRDGATLPVTLRPNQVLIDITPGKAPVIVSWR